MKAKPSELRRNYYLPRDLARIVGCPEKKIREYCKRGNIRGAKKTPGGQWRISKPLSQEARWFLGVKALLIEVGKGQPAEEFNDVDAAQELLEAMLFGKGVGEAILPWDEVDVGPVKSEAIRKIQDLIGEKFANQESLSPLILKGCVYQSWLKEQREPTVFEICELMHISESEFYRRGHNIQEIRAAYDQCELPRELPLTG